jgi:glycosyltransferase involved in cell wall biosynthesis
VIRAIQALRREGLRVALFIVSEAKFTSKSSRQDNSRYERFLRSLAGADPARRVEFLSERSEIADLYRAFDAVVLPSIEEPFGRVVIEAMASGRVVIATSVGGPPEVIARGVDGLLLAPGAAAMWAQQLALVQGHPAMRRRVEASARQTATARFSVKSYCRAMLAVYESALRRATQPLRRTGPATAGRTGPRRRREPPWPPFGSRVSRRPGLPFEVVPRTASALAMPSAPVSAI